jgi:hypothetical protein
MNKPLAFHVGIGGSTEAEKRTCGNCTMVPDMSWQKAGQTGLVMGVCQALSPKWGLMPTLSRLTMNRCKAPTPMCISYHKRPAVHEEMDASKCPCWKPRP